MPIALHSFKIDDDGHIRVQHTFYGRDEAEAEEFLEAHAEICPKFGPAERHGNTVQIVEEIDVLPTPDTADDFVGGDPDDEDDDDGEDDED
jgi:hypothetical protein